MSQCAGNVAQCLEQTHKVLSQCHKNKQIITKQEAVSVTSQCMIPSIPRTPKIIKKCSYKNGQKHGEALNDAQLYC